MIGSGRRSIGKRARESHLQLVHFDFTVFASRIGNILLDSIDSVPFRLWTSSFAIGRSNQKFVNRIIFCIIPFCVAAPNHKKQCKQNEVQDKECSDKETMFWLKAIDSRTSNKLNRIRFHNIQLSSSSFLRLDSSQKTVRAPFCLIRTLAHIASAVSASASSQQSHPLWFNLIREITNVAAQRIHIECAAHLRWRASTTMDNARGMARTVNCEHHHHHQHHQSNAVALPARLHKW